MASVTIVITDRENDEGAVDIAMEFDPRLPEKQEDATFAQFVAVRCVSQLQQMGDLAVQHVDSGDIARDA